MATVRRWFKRRIQDCDDSAELEQSAGTLRRRAPTLLMPPPRPNFRRRSLDYNPDAEAIDYSPCLRRRTMIRANPWAGDALRVWETGSLVDGGANGGSHASIGGERSSSEAGRVGWLLVEAVDGLTIVNASRANADAAGIGAITIVAGEFAKYAAPGGVAGPTIHLPAGQPRVLADGADPAKWVRVQRSSSNALRGVACLEFQPLFANVFGFQDSANAESVAGGDRYSAVMLVARRRIESVAIWLAKLATSTVATGALSGSGSGTISAAAGEFVDWPKKGFCRIEDSGGALREIVYYSSRTNAALTIPSAGRGLLGTSATAGAAGDLLHCVPGARIAHEVPVAGAIDLILDTTIEPSPAPSWSSEITSGAGLAVGGLGALGRAGLWIHRQLPAGAGGMLAMPIKISISFVCEGKTYVDTLEGWHRVANNSHVAWELHVGAGVEPDLSATPDESWTSMPHTTTYALALGVESHIAVNYRNAYDVASEATGRATIEINGAGAVTTVRPSAPSIRSWSAAAGGTFRLQASYFPVADPGPADTWKIYLRTNGTDPNPNVDTPTTVAMTTNVDGVVSLDWTSGAYAGGTDGRVILRAYRSSDSRQSTNSDVHQAIGVATSALEIVGDATFRGRATQKEP